MTIFNIRILASVTNSADPISIWSPLATKLVWEILILNGILIWFSALPLCQDLCCIDIFERVPFSRIQDKASHQTVSPAPSQNRQRGEISCKWESYHARALPVCQASHSVTIFLYNVQRIQCSTTMYCPMTQYMVSTKTAQHFDLSSVLLALRLHFRNICKLLSLKYVLIGIDGNNR